MPNKKTVWLDENGGEHHTEAEALEADAVAHIEHVILDHMRNGGIDSARLAHWIFDNYQPRDDAEKLPGGGK